MARCVQYLRCRFYLGAGSRLSQKEQGNPEVRTLKRAQDALENLVHRRNRRGIIFSPPLAVTGVVDFPAPRFEPPIQPSVDENIRNGYGFGLTDH